MRKQLLDLKLSHEFVRFIQTRLDQLLQPFSKRTISLPVDLTETEKLEFEYSRLFLMLPEKDKATFQIVYECSALSVFDLIELACYGKLGEQSKKHLRNVNIRRLIELMKPTDISENNFSDFLHFLPVSFCIDSSEFLNEFSNRYRTGTFLKKIKKNLLSHRENYGKSYAIFHQCSTFQEICREAGIQRSQYFQDKTGMTNSLGALLHAIKTQFFHAVSGENWIFPYFTFAFHFPMNFRVNNITHFDLMEIGLFFRVNITDKNPLELYIRNQNLKRWYAQPALLSKVILYENPIDMQKRIYTMHPEHALNSTAPFDVQDYFCRSLASAATTRYDFFSSAETKAINQIIISVISQQHENYIKALLTEFDSQCVDLKQASADVKSVLYEAYLINDRCQFTPLARQCNAHVSHINLLEKRLKTFGL